MAAQKFKWMGGIGVLNANATTETRAFGPASELSLSMSSNDKPIVSLESYFEYPLGKNVSLRTGLNHWRFETFNFVNNITSSSSFFSASETKVDCWGLPLNMLFKIKKIQILGGIQQNFILSHKTTRNDNNFNTSPETDELVNSAGDFFKKRFLMAQLGVNYSYKFAIFELKLNSSLGNFMENASLISDNKLSSVNLSIFLQFDFNEN
jgi:hypothetical protein